MVKKLYASLCRVEATIAGTFLIAMVALIFLGGVARLAHHPLNWTTDIATCLFAWACFLAADVAWRNNSMMAIEVVTNRLPPHIQSLLRRLNYAIIAGFLAYLIYYGFTLAWISRARSFQGIPSVSYSWVTVSLPVGALLLLITTLRKVRADLRGEVAENRATDVL
jgi:TRAP-type C4-dicarboxylate transport system permease small subunit